MFINVRASVLLCFQSLFQYPNILEGTDSTAGQIHRDEMF